MVAFWLYNQYFTAKRLRNIAFFAFIACATADRVLLQAISGYDLQVNPDIAVQLFVI
jgi:hypothetical protein